MSLSRSGGYTVLSGTIVEDSLFGAMVRWWGSGEDLRVGGTYKDKSVLLWGAKEVLTSPVLPWNTPLSFPQIYAMALCLPFGTGGSSDITTTAENTYQSFDPQGRRPPNGADLSADPSIYLRPQGLPMPGRFGVNVRRMWPDNCQMSMNHTEWEHGRHGSRRT